MLLLIILLTPFTDQIICFFVKQIIEDTDLVLCFYNGDKHTSVIPVDVAKEAGIDAVIYDLPGLHEKQMKKSFEQKIRMM